MKIRRFLTSGAGVGALIAAAAIPLYSADNDKTDTKINDRSLGPLERADKVIGKSVYTSDNQKVGKIENLIVDLESGRVLYAVVGTGILGVGGHDYAIAPSAFSDVSGEHARVNIDKAKLTGAPQFSSNVDKPEELGRTAFITQVYQYAGQPVWWQGATSSDSGTFRNVHKAKDIIGMKVKIVGNEDIGKVENLMVNLPAGRAPFVILDPASNLNLGNDMYAFPPDAFTWNADQKSLVSDVTRDKLAAAPHMEKDQLQRLSDQAYASKVYQYYGKQAYFESGRPLQPTGKETRKDQDQNK
jgi:sporulation protein YlmC with PRC-barrel domain